MEKAVCYCRVSTEEEKQLNALDKQIYELETFVKAKDDWELVETYVDEGKTGTSTKSRKSYQQLFNDLLTDKFSIIVIKDQSRLMRNVLDWYMFIDRINKNGKKLFMYLDNQYYTPDNNSFYHLPKSNVLNWILFCFCNYIIPHSTKYVNGFIKKELIFILKNQPLFLYIMPNYFSSL